MNVATLVAGCPLAGLPLLLLAPPPCFFFIVDAIVVMRRITERIDRTTITITCQLRLADAAVVLTVVDSICMTMIFALQRMSQAYCIIFLSEGYMVADVSSIDLSDRELFIQNISSRYPICYVNLDQSDESLTLFYREDNRIISHGEVDVECVVSVCDLILKTYREDPSMNIYPLDNLVDQDMNTSMLDLDIDKLNESILDQVEEKSSNDLSSIIERLDQLEETMNQMSEIVKRLALQYGILTHST